MTNADTTIVPAAMFSVYYRSLARRLEVRGAPAVLLPPEVDPLPLGDALSLLAGDPVRFREAMWTVARSVPPVRLGPGGVYRGTIDRYPRELTGLLRRGGVEGISRDDLQRFDRTRSRYRADAQLFTAALDAYLQSPEGSVTFEEIRKRFERPDREENQFDEATKKTLAFGGQSATQYFTDELDTRGNRSTVEQQLGRLEHEVGLSLPTFIQEFADAVAFAECIDGFGADTFEHDGVTVFPASSVTVQDTSNLMTRVTVTALVHTKKFACLRVGSDPQCWHLCSDAFQSTTYVDDAYRLTPLKPAPMFGAAMTGPSSRLLRERVRFAWGTGDSEFGTFDNVLNIKRFDIEPGKGLLNIEFDLNRSISSRILWDERAGGILVDEGYARARRVTEHLWRLTVRKTIQFSDRTPYAGGRGWRDLGQVLSYLAPATLSWWIEREMYSAACGTVLKFANELYPQTPPEHHATTDGEQGVVR